MARDNRFLGKTRGYEKDQDPEETTRSRRGSYVHPSVPDYSISTQTNIKEVRYGTSDDPNV